MSLKNSLIIVLMCFIMSVFMNMNLVDAEMIDCTGGFSTDSVLLSAKCVLDSEQKNPRYCDFDKCGHNNAHFVPMKNCEPYNPPGKKKSTQNCLNYQYNDGSHYSCWNAANHLFICEHQFGDKPVISCDC
ncbi:uncharacterized protein MELLADRAFT_123851 [Melampsora larici-populina 98AG31]|uniref:Secreted protein n=1 Tax=Melampsora larici-populina (strain 98AG31 / pathotype 3-4-7) TaxID=747676 RepID=F4RTE1_MELLP|nr:uncharacterized protein MELLADRAFT_123851 [Melampsora larici-populina 98AG31]EGG04355.1 secreted protein [Melampsora larici-populina 98AG31]